MTFNTPIVVSEGERGATLLEFALSLFFIGLFVTVIFDVGRYMAINAILSSSAREGLRLAQSLEFFDIEESDDSDQQELLEAIRKQVVDIAIATPTKYIDRLRLDRGTPTLKRFELIGALENETYPIYEAIILRPGESAIEVDENAGPDDTLVRLDHPNLCSPHSPSCQAPRVLSDSPNTADTKFHLRKYPIVVELRTTMRFLTPGLNKGVIRGKAVGFREMFPTIGGN